MKKRFSRHFRGLIMVFDISQKYAEKMKSACAYLCVQIYKSIVYFALNALFFEISKTTIKPQLDSRKWGNRRSRGRSRYILPECSKRKFFCCCKIVRGTDKSEKYQLGIFWHLMSMEICLMMLLLRVVSMHWPNQCMSQGWFYKFVFKIFSI